MNRFGFVVFLLVARTAHAELWNWTSAAAHHAAVVEVRAGNAGGTGCLVWSDGKRGIVLTAAHVVEGQQIAKATWKTGYQSAGKIAGRYSTQDVACFEVVPPADAVVVPVCPDPQPLGTQGEACGFGGPDGKLRSFHVKAIDGTGDRTTWQGVVISGDSGGPIFVTIDGQPYVAGTIIGGPNTSTIAGSEWQAVHPIYASKTHFCRTILAQCYGDSCIPPSRILPWRQSIEQQLYPPQAPQQKPPAASPPIASPVPQPVVPQIDYAKLADAVAEKLAADARFRGPSGVDGKPGVNGKDAVIDYNRLAEEVIRRMPPISVQTFDRNNRLVDEEAYPFGTPLKFRYGIIKGD